METLITMLRQRGVTALVPEPVGSELPGTVQKIGEYFIYFSTKSRISDKDIGIVETEMQAAGCTRGIIVLETKPSSVILNLIRKHSDVLQLFHTEQLVFDIMTHRKVPAHRILAEDEKLAFLESFRITDPQKKMPDIDSQDAAAKWIGARPGDIVEIMRKSETAGYVPYYRMCVANTSL
jgi:DNA-directed RNA polymerase subunit H (RpoH/RPB5)